MHIKWILFRLFLSTLKTWETAATQAQRKLVSSSSRLLESLPLPSLIDLVFSSPILLKNSQLLVLRQFSLTYLYQAVHGVMWEFRVVPDFHVKLEKHLGYLWVKYYVLPGRARPKGRVLVGFENRDQFLWKMNVDKRPWQDRLGQGGKPENQQQR